MLKTIIAFVTILSLMVVAMLLNLTTPATAGPIGILSIFLFSYLTSLGVTTHLIYYVSRGIGRISAMLMPRKPFQPMSFKQSYYYSSVVAMVPILFIGLQSVGAIGVYEVILIAVFVVVGCLYISKIIH
jgi:hypothetical protein